MKKLEVLSVAALAALALAAGCAKEKAANEAAKPAAQAPAAPVAAPTPAFPVEAPDSLRALTRITLDSASKLALARVPTGTIQKAELERERGAIIWSFDLKVPGQEGITEVNVDAVTGVVLPTEHEGAAAERREAREDSAHARRPAAPARPATPTTKRP